jgi:4-amino-4-deoxychorismate lyase
LHTTPTGRTGILAGTTQELLFARAAAAGWETTHTLATVEEINAADVVWLVSSVRGPIDVVTLDGTPRPRRPEIDAEIRRLTGF